MKLNLVLIMLLFVSFVSFSGCMENTQSSDVGDTIVWDANQDYFPDKVSIDYANEFSVEYHNNYKHIIVKEPESNTSYSYILVQRGTPIPETDDDSLIIEVPVESIVTLSTTHLPALDILNEQDKLKAISAFSTINSPAIREMIDNGDLVQVGSGSAVNTEKIISINPDIVMTTTMGTSMDDEHIHTLLSMGQTPVVNLDYKEQTPLGRAEWIKFVSLFFNRENEANEYFSTIETNYKQLAASANAVGDKPTVMSGMSWQGTWYVPGGDSFVAKFIEDAGAIYLWDDDNHTSSVTFDFESVFNRSKDADYWITSETTWNNMDDVEGQNPLFMEFRAAKSDNIYADNAKVNEFGGNDYYESGLVNPDVILADLVSIFHPELLPDHELVYYRRLENTSGGQ